MSNFVSVTPAKNAMPFPESPRVIYEKNPLEEVICQLRFPPILRIDTEIPAAYQDKLRTAYPVFRERQASGPNLDLPPEFANILAGSFPMQKGKSAYEFLSADEFWKVSLTREFLALSTRRYERWEQFKEHLVLPLKILETQYSPAFYTRIGLRYRDVIRRSDIGLKDVEWSQLLSPHIAAELASRDVAGFIEHADRQVVIRLQNGDSQVRIRHGLVRTEETSEICYVVDSDFFIDGRKETKHAIEILAYFNRQSGRLFRWCIADRLHEAMAPRAI